MPYRTLIMGFILLALFSCKNPLGDETSVSSSFCSGNTDPDLDEECNEEDSEATETSTWDFSTASEYTLSSSAVQVIGGEASLVPIDQLHSGSDFSGGTDLGVSLSSGVLTLSTSTPSLSATWTPYWDRLVGYWPLDNDWQDYSGNGNHGTASGDAAFTSSSKIGIAAGTFDGSGDEVNFGSDSSLDFSGDFSLSLFFYMPDFSTTGYFVSKTNYTGPGWGLAIMGASATGCGGVDGNMAFAYGGGNLDCFPEVTRTQEWTHVVVTYDSSATLLSYYINGKLIQAANKTVTFNASRYLKFGNRSSGSVYLAGVMDEVAIWDVKLNHEDISLIYHRQKQKYGGHFDSPIVDIGASGSWSSLATKTSLPFGKPLVSTGAESGADYSDIAANFSDGLAGYWPMDETAEDTVSGSDFEDRSENSNHANTTAAVTYEDPGVLKNAVYLPGAALLQIPSTAMTSRSAVSVSMWVYPKNLTQRYTTLFSQTKDTGTDGTFSLGFNNLTGVLSFAVRNTSNLSVTSGVSYGSDIEGKWVHLVGTYDGAEVKIFVNGVLKNTQAQVGSIYSSSNIIAVGGKWENGIYPTGNIKWELDGKLDEVGLWTRALSDAEVLELYRRSANRIQYQVKSCVDEDCNCGSYSSSPAGSSMDCDGDGTLNTEDTDDSYKARFKGPGGDGSTFYSELFNRSAADLGFSCSNNTSDSDSSVCVDDEIEFSNKTKTTAADYSFADMATSASVSDNTYFQYRVLMQAEDNTACTSGSVCVPELTSVEIDPTTSRYRSDSPFVTTNNGISYTSLSSISFDEDPACTYGYQLSPNGSTFYYYNGSAWVVAGSASLGFSSTATQVSSNIGSFVGAVGAGNLYLRAFLTSDSTEPCALKSVEVNYVE